MNHLHNAVRKCNYQGYGQHWGGYLLPLEVLALRDLGAHIDKHYVEWAIDCKRNGRMYGRWTYFNLDKNSGPDKEFRRLKEGLHRGD